MYTYFKYTKSLYKGGIPVAEFCVDCWNKLNETDDPKSCFVLSRELELCEGCGEWKRVVVRVRGGFLWHILFPFL